MSDERELDEIYKPSLSPQITVEQLHGMHWAPGWQYCTVWRQAKNGDPFDLAGPPDGEGWEVNVDREGGSRITVPRWSDGTVVHQAMYWRRPVKDMQPWHHRASISEKRP